jgi:integrase
VNPLSRADIDVPSKKRRVRGAIQVLEPDELRALASAAASERGRLIVKVMGYGVLRAGECGGLTRRDIVRRDGYCELRLHQQVVASVALRDHAPEDRGRVAVGTDPVRPARQRPAIGRRPQ